MCSEIWASLVAQMVKRLPAVWETWVRSLGREDPLEKEMGEGSYCTVASSTKAFLFFPLSPSGCLVASMTLLTCDCAAHEAVSHASPQVPELGTWVTSRSSLPPPGSTMPLQGGHVPQISPWEPG